MLRKSDYFEIIDKYLNKELQAPELNDFECQLKIDPELAYEVNLHLEMENAIQEKNIINLRQNLKNIANNNSGFDDNLAKGNFSFELAEELYPLDKLEQGFLTENNIVIDHSFPKIHIYQHNIAYKENLHQLYKEKANNEDAFTEDHFDLSDENLFSEIQSALEEKDINDIKANLKHIAKSMPSHFYSTQQIDEYLSGRMNHDLLEQFEFDLSSNPHLAADLKLNMEINIAANETDVIALRETLNRIHYNNQSSNSIKDLKGIEDYIYNQLSDDKLSEFEAKMEADLKLKQEVDLVKEIDMAISEKDILLLKQKLADIAEQSKEEAGNKSERSIIGRLLSKKVIAATVAASLILMLSLSSIINYSTSTNNLYQKYYNTYQLTGITRSVEQNTGKDFKDALQKFENKDFISAINLLNKVISDDKNNIAGHFYSAVAYQETGKFDNAIKQYEFVIQNRDNLFIEQAKWYLALCYLQTNENKKAYLHFSQIAQKEGFYQHKALAILRKLKYTDNS